MEGALRERYKGALCVDLFGQFGRSELQQREVPMEANQGDPSDQSKIFRPSEDVGAVWDRLV